MALPAEVLAHEFLSQVEALNAALNAGVTFGDNTAAEALLEQRAHFMEAAAEDPGCAPPLADPDRLYGRIVALLDPSSQRMCASLAGWVLFKLVSSAPMRSAQAALNAAALLPALIRDAAREGDTDSVGALQALLCGEGGVVAIKRARPLGVLDALLGRAAGPLDGATFYTLRAISELCTAEAAAAGTVRAFAKAPACVAAAARWLGRDGQGDDGSARGGAAHLLAKIVTLAAMPGGGDPASTVAEVVLSAPGIVQAIAGAVADGDQFPLMDSFELPVAAAAVTSWGSDAQRAAMAATPGFFEGVAALLAKRYGPPADAGQIATTSPLYSLFFGGTDGCASLLRHYAARPPRALLAARARLVVALGVRIASVTEWGSAAAAAATAVGGGLPQKRALAELTVALRDLTDVRSRLAQLTERDLVADGDSGGSGSGRNGGLPASSGGGGGGGGNAAAASGSGSGAAAAASSRPPVAAASSAAAPAAAAAAAAPKPRSRTCFACGREDGGGGNGDAGSNSAPLQQCRGCKGTGLKVFFCNRACLKAGWKAHKPACEAARQRRQQQQQQQQQGASGGDGAGTLG